jgi:prophage regulatory protein
MNRSLRPNQAAELLGISVPTLWRWLKNRADFPRGRKLSARCTVFNQDELTAWRDAQAAVPKAD